MGKFSIFIFQFSILFWLFATPVSAHLIGQAPFLKINGQYANLYPVPLTSLNNFDLPQDLAPDNYLINQPINFELDKGRLPAPPDIVAKTKFDWDFADGTHAQSLKNTHTFSKIGSYILKIYADDGTTPTPQLLESALVNVLPQSSYQLPQSKILVNGKESKDPLVDIIFVDLSKSVELDGTKSVGNSKLEYFWDFGDQKSAFGQVQTHTYPDKNQSQIFILLRVKENGFLSDSFVEVEDTSVTNTSATSSAITKPIPTPTKKSQLPTTIAAICVGLTLIIMARLWLRGPRHGKHQ